MAGQLKNDAHFGNYNGYWYRQRVLDNIFEMYFGDFGTREPRSLLLSELIENDGVELFKASIIFFGGWSNAVKASGLGPELDKLLSSLGSLGSEDSESSEYWDIERVRTQIRALFQGQIELSAGFIRHTYPELYYAALDKDVYGNWLDALVDAEVEPKYLKLTRNRIWTVEQIFNTLIDYDQAYGNIQPSMVRIQNPTLYSASGRYFKTWSETISRAGLNLNKNLIKVVIEPLRNYIVIEYLKRIFDAQGLAYKEHNLELSASKMEMYGLNIPELEEIPSVHIETSDDTNNICFLANYRSWGLGIEQVIHELMDSYKQIEIYSSVGEPRSWVDDNIKFKNLNMFFTELANLGRDDIIADLSLLARGGIPKQYQNIYENIMKSMRKSIKK